VFIGMPRKADARRDYDSPRKSPGEGAIAADLPPRRDVAPPRPDAPPPPPATEAKLEAAWFWIAVIVGIAIIGSVLDSIHSGSDTSGWDAGAAASDCLQPAVAWLETLRCSCIGSR
jgi:hypothetical protein